MGTGSRDVAPEQRSTYYRKSENVERYFEGFLVTFRVHFFYLFSGSIPVAMGVPPEYLYNDPTVALVHVSGAIGGDLGMWSSHD